jgi:hypothetical protein
MLDAEGLFKDFGVARLELGHAEPILVQQQRGSFRR